MAVAQCPSPRIFHGLAFKDTWYRGRNRHSFPSHALYFFPLKTDSPSVFWPIHFLKWILGLSGSISRWWLLFLYLRRMIWFTAGCWFHCYRVWLWFRYLYGTIKVFLTLGRFIGCEVQKADGVELREWRGIEEDSVHKRIQLLNTFWCSVVAGPFLILAKMRDCGMLVIQACVIPSYPIRSPLFCHLELFSAFWSAGAD